MSFYGDLKSKNCSKNSRKLPEQKLKNVEKKSKKSKKFNENDQNDEKKSIENNFTKKISKFRAWLMCMTHLYLLYFIPTV